MAKKTTKKFRGMGHPAHLLIDRTGDMGFLYRSSAAATVRLTDPMTHPRHFRHRV